MFGRERIEIKTPEQVLAMRRAGLLTHAALESARAAIRPGVSTRELDAVAAEVIRAGGGTSNFLGYHGYPATLCISVNHVVVHGIPGEQVLREGDVVSVDGGAVVDGWHGDSAFTAIVGEPADPADAELVETTRRAMWAGIAALDRRGRVGDVGAAVEDAVDGRFGIVDGYTGHGIGTAMHMAPEVLNYRVREKGPKVRPGLCLAVEPMCTRGGVETDVLADEWTVVTSDGSRAAHWEHTVAVLEKGLWVLTAPDGGASELGPLGVDVPQD
ncbi:type I methionyl aminopeptidase [Kineococcus indalonis]|uniref:type I methionyl aminopeptidase n=1 Tax=Kineococcus indalonis TaxID=2696566 RepID=UPI001412301D|nr:type I methionyl aminopeptidase [Kineococcus indalonis]NAZ84718.1 type I methionyl aminopeptidase [Kineococcus indalonis]